MVELGFEPSETFRLGSLELIAGLRRLSQSAKHGETVAVKANHALWQVFFIRSQRITYIL